MTTTRSARGTFTLSAHHYTSEAVFAEERRRIFERNWLCAGHASELPRPGSFLRFDLGDESLIVVRDRDDTLRAFFNVCRHRGTQLCWEERGDAGAALVCPYHAWVYGLDGALVAAPNMTAKDDPPFDKSRYPLTPAPLAVWDGFLFVSLDPDPEPFESARAMLLGKFDAWRLADLRSVERKVYEVDANWKLFFENYSECYHCPVAHPALNRLTPFMGSQSDLDDGPVIGGPMILRPEAESMTTTGKACAPPLGDVSGDDLRRVSYYTIFPNLFLSVHPDYVLTHRIEPLRCDRTRIVSDWFFAPRAIAEPGFDPGPAIEFWHTTNEQDWELCRRAQRGIRSRAYRPGPYGGLESHSAAVVREYRRVMGDDA